MIGSIQPDTAYQGIEYKKTKNDPKVQQVIQQLKIIEQKVKAHEMAHKAAGGDLAGPIHYKYQKGPDGKLYIVGGEVPIKIKEGKTPEETIEIAQKIKRAALAPADPSPQDRAVAARASILEMKARAELSKQQTEKKDTGQNINMFV
ncbi:putative metalloprotease CJM1_0395 family protein [Persephonella sp.]